jgi:energy-coupling factor transporter transmembrane protein EcfT
MVIENKTFHRISTAALLLVFAFVIAMITSSQDGLTDRQYEALSLWVMIMIAATVLPTVSSALSHMIKHKRYGWLWSILILNIFAFYAYGFWVQSTDEGIPDPG